MFYGIQIPKPKEAEDPNRRPTAEELCTAYSGNYENEFEYFI